MMEGDNETQGQAGEGTPEATGQSAFDPASHEVDVAGRKMTVADLAKSYVESEKTMRDAQQSAHGYKTQLDNYSWANDLQSRYQNEPAFRQAIDEAIEQGQGGGVNQMRPEYQELQALKQEQALMRMERQFDVIRTEGEELTKEMEQRILQEIATNPAVQDAKAAYRNLFWDQAMARRAEQATAATADQMSQNKGSYSQQPKGNSPASPSKPDVTKMTPAQRDEYLMKRIKEDLDF